MKARPAYEGFDAGAASFDDAFAQEGVVGNGVIAVVTGHAEAGGGKSGLLLLLALQVAAILLLRLGITSRLGLDL